MKIANTPFQPPLLPIVRCHGDIVFGTNTCQPIVNTCHISPISSYWDLIVADLRYAKDIFYDTIIIIIIMTQIPI